MTKADTILTKEEFMKEYGSTNEFHYMLLDRMRSDCDYYLNVELPMNCQKEYNHLLAHHDPKAQITYMRYLWEIVPEKPEWLTMEQIDEYANKMGVKGGTTMTDKEAIQSRIDELYNRLDNLEGCTDNEVYASTCKSIRSEIDTLCEALDNL